MDSCSLVCMPHLTEVYRNSYVALERAFLLAGRSHNTMHAQTSNRRAASF